ncbi:MAG: hypothetical protein U5R30_10355 [Deltaproteobacteria bacterium]|nr:hypothetical protein [Deltaproteobacteria bacterium]
MPSSAALITMQQGQESRSPGQGRFLVIFTFINTFAHQDFVKRNRLSRSANA